MQGDSDKRLTSREDPCFAGLSSCFPLMQPYRQPHCPVHPPRPRARPCAGAASAAPVSASAPAPAGLRRRNPTEAGHGARPGRRRLLGRSVRDARSGSRCSSVAATRSTPPWRPRPRLGVTEPFSTGVGGGGYFVYYDAASGQVRTLDGRETAPRSMPRDAFIDPATGDPYNFTPERVTSGVSVGVPGTPLTWTTALRKWGTRSLAASLRPPTGWRAAGSRSTRPSASRPRTTRSVSASSGRPGRSSSRAAEAPAVGSTLEPGPGPHLPGFAKQGARFFYRGRLPVKIVRAVRKPPTIANPTLPIPTGFMTRRDLAPLPGAAEVDPPTSPTAATTSTAWAAPPAAAPRSARRSTSSRARDLSSMPPVAALHRYLEASALAFADRGAYVGDDEYVDVPRADLLSQKFADERACEIDPAAALAKPTAAGDVTSYDGHVRSGSQRGKRSPRTPRTSRPPTSRSPTSGATSSPTRSPSSRPAAPASSCPIGASCSTTS